MSETDLSLNIEAGKILIDLSSELIHAALTMMTVEVVYIVFVLKERQPNFGFGCAAIATGILAISSIFFGGRGTNIIAKQIAKSELDVSIRNDNYDWQALLCVVGIIAFAFMISLSGWNSKDNNKE